MTTYMVEITRTIRVRALVGSESIHGVQNWINALDRDAFHDRFGVLQQEDHSPIIRIGPKEMRSELAVDIHGKEVPLATTSCGPKVVTLQLPDRGKLIGALALHGQRVKAGEAWRGYLYANPNGTWCLRANSGSVLLDAAPGYMSKIAVLIDRASTMDEIADEVLGCLSKQWVW